MIVLILCLDNPDLSERTVRVIPFSARISLIFRASIFKILPPCFRFGNFIITISVTIVKKKVDKSVTSVYTVREVITLSTLGERIKAARIKCDMTQEQLAAALDTTKAAVSRYEAGKREPNLEQLRKIAKATNTTVSELVDEGYWSKVPKYEYEASFSNNPQQVILCGLFDQLNEVGQQKAIERLEELLEVAKYRK